MGQEIVKVFSKVFEGEDIPVFEMGGEPIFLLSNLSEVLGYESTRGNRLSKLISSDWKDGFDEGVEYEILKGKKLKDFKELLDASPSAGLGSKASSVMVLRESGLYQVLSRSNKPVAIRFQKWVSRKLIPAYRRGQLAELMDRPSDPRLVLEEKREERKMIEAQTSMMREERLKAESEVRASREDRLNRQNKVKGLKEVAKIKRESGLIDEGEYLRVIAECAKISSGDDVEEDPNGPWLTVSEMAAMLGVSEQGLGRRVKELGYIASHADVRVVAVPRRNGTGNCAVNEYNVHAFDVIRQDSKRQIRKGGKAQLSLLPGLAKKSN